MAKKDKRKTLVYLIPEGETRDSHTYHYTALKTKRLTIENIKLKLRKYNPVKRKHEMFVEAKITPTPEKANGFFRQLLKVRFNLYEGRKTRMCRF